MRFLSGDFLGREVDLVPGNNAVGRASENQVVIDHASVSRRHCVVLVHGDEVIVRELGSHNGTFVGGVRVDGQRVVTGGETIRFGQVEARLLLSEADRLDEDSTLSATHAYQTFLERVAKAPQIPPKPGGTRSSPPRPEPATVVVAPDPSTAPRRTDPMPVQARPQRAGPNWPLILLAAAIALALGAAGLWWVLRH